MIDRKDARLTPIPDALSYDGRMSTSEPCWFGESVADGITHFSDAPCDDAEEADRYA